jgi:hypothetical protein
LAAAGIPDHLWKIGSGGILKGYMSKDTVDQAIKDLGRSGKAVLEIDKVVADNSHILKAALRHYESWVEAVKFNTGIEIKFPDLPEVAELRIEETAAEAGVETAIDEPQSEPAAAAGEMAAAKGPGDAKLMGEISSALPARAQFFKTNLMNILARYPDKTFVLAVDTDLGRHHKSQIMPISKAIDEINALKGADDKPLFPNLRAIRAPGGRLARELLRLKYGESIELSRMFVAAQQENVENRAFDVVKGEAGAWITAIDDSVPGDYLPVFEALTLNMMMAAGAESQAIKSFYDSLSREPIDPARIDEAKRMRILYLVPKAARLEPDQLRKLYELAQAVHVAA